MRAAVALGSNLGHRVETLRKAREQIAAWSKGRRPILSSCIYETEPVGCEKGAPKFLNAVIEFEFDGDPKDLLRELAEIERLLGRPLERARNSSRLIDLDLLYIDQLEIKSEALQLPHPRMPQREFVLRPLADIDPDRILPNQTEPVSVLLQRCAVPGKVVRFSTQW